MKPTIEYSIIADAERYYSHQGFTKVHLPWVVGKDGIEATLAPSSGRTADPLDDMFLVGSAEQSFISEVQSRHLTLGVPYVSTTPCFRQEPKLDDLHCRYFMKTELFLALSMDRWSEATNALNRFLATAYSFFSRYLPVRFCPTDDGIDIVSASHGTELGSYGIRRRGDIGWVYGTGVAEPRLSTCLPQQPGYHLDIIPKERVGTAEKIVEEALELLDAKHQNNPVMMLVEMSDLIGAIQLLIEERFGNKWTLTDLITMADTTRRAFVNGRRPTRQVESAVIPGIRCKL